jgi:hypothetical protein
MKGHAVFAAATNWPEAVVGAALFLGLFMFLAVAVNAWATNRKGHTGETLAKEVAEMRDDLRALGAKVDDLKRLLETVE